MSCREKNMVAQGSVGTLGSTTLQFNPMTPPIEIARISGVIASLELMEAASDAEFLPALRYSNDPSKASSTWTGEAGLAGTSATSSAGITYSTFQTLSSSYRYVQLGVYARNTGATTTKRKVPVRLTLQFKAA